MSDRPWTPGPWLYRPKSGSWHAEPDIDTGYSYGQAFITTPDACDMEFRNEADADLIALAPEMAEAILACADQPSYDANLIPIDLMADKLRAIGGDQ